MAEHNLGLSFDDVLLVPQRSSVLPNLVSLGSSLTNEIELTSPVISAAMDTVSESELAIALAREGGIGVIHRACSIEEQTMMVSRVKRSENAVIHHPEIVTKDMTVGQVRALVEERGFSGFPVVSEEGTLEGMVTGRDLRYFDGENEKKVEQVMTPRDRLITAGPDTGMEAARRVLYENRIEKLPLVDETGKLVGLITGADIEKRITYTSAAKDPDGRLRCGAAVGVGPDFKDRGQALIEAGADALFIDAATGHTDRAVSYTHLTLPTTPYV